MRALVPLTLLALLAAALPVAATSQVHLGLSSSDAATQATVVWVEPEVVDRPEVRVTGPLFNRTFPAVAVPGPGPGVVYEARLTGLQPGTPYTYEVGGRAFQFTTAPRALSEEPVRIAAIADVGIKPTSRAAVNALLEADPDLVIVPGDLAYAYGSADVWRQWFEMIEPAAATRPWMIALGNHEMDTEYDRNLYYQRHAFPGNERWYSFDWAGIHFVALDTWGGDFSKFRHEEAEWLRQDLAANKDAAWTVVYLHAPFYSSFRHGGQAHVVEAFRDILEAGGVDLVVTAHDHAYERTHPLRNDTVVTRNSTVREGLGTVYLVTGGGGQSLYDPKLHPAPNWSAARGKHYHFVELLVNETMIEGRVVATDGSGFTDSFRIEKPPKPKPVDPGPTTTTTTTTTTTRQQTPTGGSPVTETVESPAVGAVLLVLVGAASARLLRRR
ncbi:MAG TPA: metallophosphoesterase family protein [Candidatus Thermoplasmatota archaeon]|nr:metallophosphoesterase family protein [Candidatus Thermoplasmatota archaeon]